MAATCVPLSAVEPTNPHPTETDDIFCNMNAMQNILEGSREGKNGEILWCRI
jgi:hypothetical protein